MIIRAIMNELDELFGAAVAGFVILCIIFLVVGLIFVMTFALAMLWQFGPYTRAGMLGFAAIWAGLSAWLRWSK